MTYDNTYRTLKKDNLMLSMSSAYRHRPAVLECVKKNMGKHMY